MDIPAAAPAQSGNQSDSDLLQQQSTPLTWITFGGAPHESSADFIQSIQRLAFQRNRLKDDKWITEYASTCFNGDALFWYLELDEEIQESWKRLRLALARRFPATPKPAETKTIPSSLSSVQTPTLGGISISNTTWKRGCIEVLGELASPLGYLASHPASGISITPSKDKAVIITRPDPTSLERPSEPYHIQMVGLSGPPAAFPFLGLALLKDQAEDCAVPRAVGTYFNGGGWVDVPLPSRMCKTKEAPGPLSNPNSVRPQLATWIWSNCGKSRFSLAWLRKSETQAPNTKAAAAIWKYNSSRTDDLYLYWIMDDKVECELGAYVHSSTNGSLHVHRLNDVNAAGKWLDEVRVQLVFKEIP